MTTSRSNPRMSRRNRVLILVASLALGLMYALPVWTIKLEAPQYPEGLGMVIRINTIEGQKEHDLSNINNLNHYIGMQRIVPESIPELKIMPVIVAVLMLAGLAVSALGRRRLLYAWTIAFLTVSAVGLADFWKWEYDYGHNLDEEHAIIKIPGMSYQPPLIGSRKILNFTAHSWPGAGGAAAILAALTAVLVSLDERRRRGGASPRPKASEDAADPPEESSAPGTAPPQRGAPGQGTSAAQRSPGQGTSAAGGAARARGAAPARGTSPAPKANRAGAPGAGIALALLTLTAAACAEPAPRPLASGIDTCAQCLMVVDAEGHGAEIVLETGKVYTFDSVECMVNHVETNASEAPVHSAWVTDFASPTELVAAAAAYYLVSPTLTSPMGLGLTAFRRQEDRDGAVHVFGGQPLDWDDVRALVASAWPDGRPTMNHGGHSSTLIPPDAPRRGGPATLTATTPVPATTPAPAPAGR